MEEGFNQEGLGGVVSISFTGGRGEGGTSWKMRVRMKVTLGETLGRTANALSPTKPLVTLFTADASTWSPSLGATIHSISTHHLLQPKERDLPIINTRSRNE